jgi:hypothetical protein
LSPQQSDNQLIFIGSNASFNRPTILIRTLLAAHREVGCAAFVLLGLGKLAENDVADREGVVEGVPLL